MASTEELKKVRLEKLNKIKAAGIDPYPISVEKTHSLSDLSNEYTKLSLLKKKSYRRGKDNEFTWSGRHSFC